MAQRVLLLKGALRKLKRDQNRNRSPTRSERIRQVQRQIRQIDTEFRQLTSDDLKKPVRVNGFSFPMSCEEDIERLELMVERNPSIREQFVNYLRRRKPFSESVEECFGYFFKDEAMLRYNWKGLDRNQCPRKAMMNYHIFTDCMMDAWVTHGVQKDVLQNELRKTVFKISRRRYSNKCARKKRSIDRSSNYGPKCDD
ncbi:uncharacterized protein LOC135697385 isoform X1 [Ochlerotatus camptorhynchus]|uniref:uncharacterized protein LOC135697385 isoform X1 n=1 Tax=Ochlerotatus camptorhynchus TaxID=644619 RepID=UPI0031D9C439